MYLQQNAFDEVDAASSPERQKYVFDVVYDILKREYVFKDKNEARDFFYKLRQSFIDWNYIKMDTDRFKQQEESIKKLVEEYTKHEKSI